MTKGDRWISRAITIVTGDELWRGVEDHSAYPWFKERYGSRGDDHAHWYLTNRVS